MPRTTQTTRTIRVAAVGALVGVSAIGFGAASRYQNLARQNAEALDLIGARTPGANTFTAPHARTLSATDYAGLLENARAELSSTTDVEERRQLAERLREIGVSAHMTDRGEGKIALAAYDAAIDVFREQSSFDRLRVTLPDAADAALLLGERGRAVDAWSEAKRLPGADADPILLLRAGAFSRSVGDLPDAERLILRALTLQKTAGDGREMGQCLRELGALFLDRREFERAAKTLSESARLLTGEADVETRAAVLGTWGDALLRSGRVGDAQKLYAEGAAVWETRPNASWKARFRARLAHAAWHRGEFGPAQRLAHESLTLLKNSNSPTARVLPMHVLGNVARSRGRISEAIDWHERAQAIREKIGNPAAIAEGRDALQADRRTKITG